MQIIDQREVLGKGFRIFGNYDNPLFLAKDVAEWIDYSYKDARQIHRDVSKMISSVDDDEKLKATLNLGGEDCSHGGIRENTEMWFLTENGVYEVLMQSRKPIAKQFKSKVKEILRTIRKTGGYVDNDELFVNTYLQHADDNMKQLFKLNLMTIRKLNEKIDYMEPLAEFAETVTNSADTIDIGQLATLAHDEHIDIGRNRLFEWMRKQGYLRGNNEPYQEYINRGWFKVIEQIYTTSYGEKLNVKTLVTGKGQVAIIEKLRKHL